MRQLDWKKRNSNVMSLKKQSGEDMNALEISETLHSYYKNLYSFDDSTPRTDNGDDWEHEASVSRSLSEEAKLAIGGEVTEGEIKFILFKKMKIGKAPGLDGFTVGFWRKFWDEIKEKLTMIIRCCIEGEEMTDSQRESMIRLLLKQGKDPGILKSWRPISLSNVDSKILPTIFAMRLEPFMDDLIHSSQLAYIKGRQITEGNLTTQIILEFYTKMQKNAIIAGFDFSNAFDSANICFLRKILENINLPTIMLEIIQCHLQKL